ncbi:TorF family putative porin [Sphingomonas nostoxanthinifaciens]|uniref:TorF family putative porin n=1 Tax=Sphingomonas nostoxanthinifaciens TaxID=2872652 RepID=UPI001CC1E02D|nr:TorF family putative porin [Sphingomonas nostoxanthinifaciens]
MIAAPAFAQDAAPAGPAAPPSAFTVTGGATLISDYRFRGLSQTNTHAAIQGTIGVSHSSGLYIGTWGSSIDDYIAAGSDQEIDLYGGYKKTVAGWAFDGGMLYYFYSGNAKGTTTDFFEPYLNASHTFGPVGVKVGLNYSWKQHALRCDYDPRCPGARQDNLYTYGELSGAIPHTGVTITGHIGETWGRSYLTNGLKDYTDWSLTAAYTWKSLTFSVAYVDTDVKQGEIVSPSGRNIGKAGVVGGVGIAF